MLPEDPVHGCRCAFREVKGKVNRASCTALDFPEFPPSTFPARREADINRRSSAPRYSLYGGNRFTTKPAAEVDPPSRPPRGRRTLESRQALPPDFLAYCHEAVLLCLLHVPSCLPKVPFCLNQVLPCLYSVPVCLNPIPACLNHVLICLKFVLDNRTGLFPLEKCDLYNDFPLEKCDICYNFP